MRLHPVYLVAPEPEPPTVSRRAFVTTVVGTAITAGTVGWWLAPRTPAVRSTSVDPKLEWALQLLRGADRDLVRHAEGYLATLWEHVERHPELWEGFERITLHVTQASATSRSEQQELAISLVQTLENYRHPRHLDRYLATLRRLGR